MIQTARELQMLLFRVEKLLDYLNQMDESSCALVYWTWDKTCQASISNSAIDFVIVSLYLSVPPLADALKQYSWNSTLRSMDEKHYRRAIY